MPECRSTGVFPADGVNSMKKIASHIKTTATDFGDMVRKGQTEPAPSVELDEVRAEPGSGPAQTDAHYDTHYIVDDLQAGTVVRKAAVQMGLLLVSIC